MATLLELIPMGSGLRVQLCMVRGPRLELCETVDMEMTPLFIPLKTEYFEAFANGSKDTEYRPFGVRWNERTCAIGRPVVLSKGYGKGSRLRGVVTGFVRSRTSRPSAAWVACYGSRECDMACIQIRVTRSAASISKQQVDR